MLQIPFGNIHIAVPLDILLQSIVDFQDDFVFLVSKWDDVGLQVLYVEGIVLERHRGLEQHIALFSVADLPIGIDRYLNGVEITTANLVENQKLRPPTSENFGELVGSLKNLFAAPLFLGVECKARVVPGSHQNQFELKILIHLIEVDDIGNKDSHHDFCGGTGRTRHTRVDGVGAWRQYKAEPYKEKTDCVFGQHQ